jgi:uncharacterized repeat protein (TIGR03803 family)
MTKFCHSSRAAVLVASLSIALAGSTAAAEAQTLTTLHAFKGGAKDGRSSDADLIFNRAGTTIYGTTQFGGTKDTGTVFALDPATGATTVLHSFTGIAEGLFPQAGLTMDRSGALYGTTISVPESGGGAVFKLDPATNTFSVLHSFRGGNDGFFPSAPVTLDKKNNVYGTTEDGGGADDLHNCPLFCGTVFRIDSKTKATTILHSFTGGPDGGHPFTRLTPGPDGLYYGTTFDGGSATCGISGCGTVFRIDPATGALTTLHAFQDGDTDGAFPLGSLVFDKSGIIYGTTEGGGPKHSGTIYRLDLTTGVLTVLHTFTLLDDNGGFPNAGLTFNSAGTLLYGTNTFGGSPEDRCRNGGDAGCGTVFSFDPASGAYNVLYRFTGGSDGGNPSAGLLLGPNGLLYGTTELDGVKKNAGTVFTIAP